MSSVNKVILLGRLGADPELKKGNQHNYTFFSLATSKKWKGQDGSDNEKTEWHDLIAYGKKAEIICQYLKKGSRAYIEGELESSIYEKDGVKRKSVKIIVNEVRFIGDAKEQQPSASKQPNAPPNHYSGNFAPDDDVPF